MSEREIKTVLTLDDASFSKGLKAATNSVSAARAEMDASVASATGLGKGLKKYTAQITGLNKTIKAEKQQMAVLNKEYKTQQSRLKELSKALQDANEKNGEGSKEAEKAANAYASQSAKVDELRTKMAKLTTTMAQDSSRLKSTMTAPFISMAKAATAAVAVAGAALVQFTLEANQAENNLALSLNESKVTFGIWSKFLEQEAVNAWKTIGLSKDQYLGLASEIGDYLTEAGEPIEQAAQASAQIIEGASKLSKEYGIPIAEVWENIKDAADGSKTAVKRYGIQMGSTATTTANANRQLDEQENKLANINQILAGINQTKWTYNTDTSDINQAANKLSAVWTNFLSGNGDEKALAEAATEYGIAWAQSLSDRSAQIVAVAGPFFNSFAEELWARVTANIPNWLGDLLNTLFPDKKAETEKTAAEAAQAAAGEVKVIGAETEKAAAEAAQAAAGAVKVISDAADTLSKWNRAASEELGARGYNGWAAVYGATANKNAIFSAFLSGQMKGQESDTNQEFLRGRHGTMTEVIKERMIEAGKAAFIEMGKSQDMTEWLIGRYGADKAAILRDYYAKYNSAITGGADIETQSKALIEFYEQLGLAEKFISKPAEDLSSTLDNSSKSIAVSFDNMKNALNEATQTLLNFAAGGATGGGQFNALRDIGGSEGNFHHPHFGGGMQPSGGFAGGAWNIPSDNYIARLHAGEMVLTADQARRYRAEVAKGGNTYNNDVANIYIDKNYQTGPDDTNALLNQLQLLQKRRRMGYGLT